MVGRRNAPRTVRDRRYWLRLLTLFGVSLSVALISLPALMGVLFTIGLLYVPCGASSATPDDYGYNFEDVTIQARAGGSFHGYFIPGSDGAAVIIPPALASGRGSRLDEAVVLAKHGYSVFIFESRRCAGMGPLSLGYKEVDEVADALAYVQARPEVDPDRIGILGFSSAGATAVMAAARLPALQAVVAEGGYGDFAGETLTPGRQNKRWATYFEIVYYWAVRVTYRIITGLNIDKLSPRDVIADISPRPVLLIYGSREVSLVGGRAQKAAGGNNATLWIVEGAGHGNYLQVAPEAYKARVVSFFDQALR
jgi:dienelactone hydrolase